MASGRIKGFWRSGKPTCLFRGTAPAQIPAWILRSALLRRDRIVRAPDRVIPAIMRLPASGGVTGRSDPVGARSSLPLDHLARNRPRSFGDRRRSTWQLTRCLVPRLGNHSPQGRQTDWRGHGAAWPGTPVSGRTPMSGAFVSGCASAAARSPASRSTRGVRSGTSRPTGASRSAGVTGAARWSRASCMAGVRGSMVWTTTSSSTSAVAAVRRSASTPVCRTSLSGDGHRS